MKESVSRNH